METENMSGEAGSGSGTKTEAVNRMEKVRDVIAETLRTTSAKLEEKAATPDAKPGTARYARRAADWLERSAECVSGFDCNRTDARIRDYVGRNPGRTLLMAAATGLVLGVALRRR